MYITFLKFGSLFLLIPCIIQWILKKKLLTLKIILVLLFNNIFNRYTDNETRHFIKKYLNLGQRGIKLSNKVLS